ncbi:hypothetical protein DH09_04210 [Bacillaceae bacterium JMAK1]|nr:hypothetical protein DH09_04210 [Bacillaceae bacterium JMAK1]
MTIERYSMNLDKWLSGYASGDDEIQCLFDYRPIGHSTERFEELKSYQLTHDDLRHALSDYHQQFEYNDMQLAQIEKLKDPNTTVVVGGQQAGLFTGPIYTIAKALTIIQKAKMEEERLQTPVIPVFWIAGEDHDVDEVNHVYVHSANGSVKRVKYSGETKVGAPVTHQPLDREAMETMIDEILIALGETDHTKSLRQKLQQFATRSRTFTHFFAEMMSWIFKDEGLVLIDPEEPIFRGMMGNIFEALLLQNDDVRQSFTKSSERMEEQGEEPFITLSKDHAHLFYHIDGYREKLVANDDGTLSLSDHRFSQSSKQWAQEAKEHPERFSSNVFTRPFVQEQMLPVLYFVAGPGEIKYWSMLKPLFHQFDRKVPPVTLRLQQTFVNRRSEKGIRISQRTPLEIVSEGTRARREELKEKYHTVDSEKLYERSVGLLEEAEKQMREALLSFSKSEERYSDRRLNEMKRTFEAMRDRIDSWQYHKANVDINKLTHAESHLSPNGKPQERMLTIVQVINEIGIERLRTLLFSATFEEYQHLVYYE